MITINGIEIKMKKENISIHQFIAYLKQIGFKDTALENPMLVINGKYIPHDQYSECLIHEGDEVMLISQTIGG